ncbi:MAG: tail protein X [Paracoccus sp. (in: a-proteobacteria)]|nr:tail protein X [Paracoccus sp. (in: a-proteobacteria)]
MTGVWITRDGDVLDLICREKLGSEAHVPAVLAANPGLAARGPIYPAGVRIILPDTPVETRARGDIRLWGRT